ncbi:hypothetical protein ACSNOI_17625 [Actinomadura kijaniata]|uniref:hypothetical protein n=1 Tax=Actinomadura kijaniata TaxID=46161 RepID=UPI003F1CE398
MLSMALHLRDLAVRLVITTGTEEGKHPSPATVMRMLRDHDQATPMTPLTPPTILKSTRPRLDPPPACREWRQNSCSFRS